MSDSKTTEISYEKDVTTCTEGCLGTQCPKKDDCSGPSCFCPFNSKQCVDDPCDLALCSRGSDCISSTQGYDCECPPGSNGPYCDLEEEEVCPSHWWGRPVCGPCQCDVAHGFNESCAIDSGKCSCKANHFVMGGKCQPCECYSYGSLSPACDIDTGACSCRPGVSGHKCDKCSHGFAELTSSGCHVIYGVCPAEYSNGIWWPRTVFGDLPNATCPDNAVGLTSRHCTPTGWVKSDLSGCIHQEFIVLSNNLQTSQESWVLAKKAKDTLAEAAQVYQDSDLYDKDVAAIESSVFKVLDQETNAVGFELAHKKDRQFLDHFIGVVSWLFKQESGNSSVSLKDVHLISTMSEYGRTIARAMESTFTNPFEVITDNVIFGLDLVGPKGAAPDNRVSRELQSSSGGVVQSPTNGSPVTKIPKYNNYMRKSNLWNTARAELVTFSKDTIIHYNVFRTNKSSVEREYLLVPRLLWGTQVKMFSNIVGIVIEPPNDVDEALLFVNNRGGLVSDSSQTPVALVRSIVFKAQLDSPQNRLHCVAWDRDLWNAIDCETTVESADHKDLEMTVNCSCHTPNAPNKVIVSVLEEAITDGHDYLETRLQSIIFSICSSLSLAILLLTAGCLIMLNTRNKTSIRIHRNILLCVLCIQILVLIVVLANTQLTSLAFVCTFITMVLHYASVATFVWISIESIHIYRMLSELRDINHGRTTFYSAAGFGIPALVVGLTMGVSGNNYGSASFCWLPYSHSSVWGMLGPEIMCALIHVLTMLLNLRTVFRVKTDLEDFAMLRTVFFINAGLLPLVAGFHVTALIMINDRGVHAIYTFAGIAVVLSVYLLCGFIICDKTLMRALAQCTGTSKGRKPSLDQGLTGVGVAGGGGNLTMTSNRASRSALSYGQRGKHYNHPNNLDAGAELSVASTTSQLTYQTSSKFKSSHHTNIDEPDLHGRYFNGSDSDSDMDRRSLDLASSHSSDEDYDNNVYDPSDLKTLSVNDYPQY
jgi:cadherin EGF LAG seven-pass G-type receptor 1